MKPLRALSLAVLAGWALCGGAVFASALPPECGRLANAYGPYDYTNPEHRARYLPVVERHHFTTNVETLMRGQSSDNIPGDIDYTLRAFPNHPRALNAMARYQLLNRRSPNASFYTADCYFMRAILFQPADGMVRMIYGIYLHKKGDHDGASRYYHEAIDLMPESAEAYYNLGLLYVDLERYPEALAEAKRAYALGYPLPGLQMRLKRLGVWDDKPADLPVARTKSEGDEGEDTGSDDASFTPGL